MLWTSQLDIYVWKKRSWSQKWIHVNELNARPKEKSLQLKIAIGVEQSARRRKAQDKCEYIKESNEPLTQLAVMLINFSRN